MKKERLFYLDFVRAVATIIIVLTHYNAIFLYTNPPMPEKAVLGISFANVYIGDFGVSLFLTISGAALMYVYQEELKCRDFYRKRFLNIYPMYWIGFILAFLIEFYKNRGFNPDIPRYKIIYSFLGIDKYMSNFGDINFSLVGEWFLGLIIVFYLLFPLIRKWMNTSSISLGVIATIVFIVFLVMNFDQNSILLPVLLPRILFGMYFVKSKRKVNLPVAVVSLAILVINYLAAPSINRDLQATYVGICGFLVLVYIADYLRWVPFRRLCSLICKYSYAIFIVHHMVILQIVSRMDLNALTRTYSYLLFMTCCIAVFAVAYLLQRIYDSIMELFKKDERSV
ncbi:acyltransferase [Blautia liquoris]|uniref:Acyltransferase n=1 Tax=Blautia liquoris TaxID=2779518 RepID=A0A7M2RIE5_9FIRM|nr:acyltransferase [Blautia liquoris]QOV20095.1 acyltransferase [Blautia liquoris]